LAGVTDTGRKIVFARVTFVWARVTFVWAGVTIVWARVRTVRATAAARHICEDPRKG